MHVVDDNAGVLVNYEIFLVAAMDNLVGPQISVSQIFSAAPGTVMIKQDYITKLIGWKIRKDVILTSRLAGRDSNEGVSNKGL